MSIDQPLTLRMVEPGAAGDLCRLLVLCLTVSLSELLPLDGYFSQSIARRSVPPLRLGCSGYAALGGNMPMPVAEARAPGGSPAGWCSRCAVFCRGELCRQPVPKYRSSVKMRFRPVA